MSSISNKLRVKELTLQYISQVSNTCSQTQANLKYVHAIVESFISSVGIDIAEQYIDIDKAEGKWLNDIAKMVGVSREDLQGSIHYNDDEFLRTYIRFAIVKNFSKASIISFAEILYVLFGNKVYAVRQTQSFVLGIFADTTLFATIKFLIDNELFPLPLCHNIFLLGTTPPTGFDWWGYFNLPYSVVIDGGMTEEEYNTLLSSQENWIWQPIDGGKKFLLIPEEFIYRPNGN